MLVHELDNSGDERGDSYTIPEPLLRRLGQVRDVHVTTVLPGHLRGNHFHEEKEETIIVVASGSWILRWEDEARVVHERPFASAGSVAIEVDRGLSHAVANTGDRPLVVVALSSRAFDPASADAHHRPLQP